MIKISLMQRTISHLFITMVLLLVAVGTQANEVAYKQYQQKKTELAVMNEKLEKAKIGYQSVKIELKAETSKLDVLKSEVDAEKAKLDKLRNFEEQNPEFDLGDKINDQRMVWKKANQKYLSNKEYVSSLNSKASEYKTQYDIAFNNKKTLTARLQQFSDEFAGSQVNEKLKKMQRSKRITIKIRETCSLSMTKDQCRDQARVKAERQAAERGALVVVESVTEIKNFNLTKDEARSRVSARISQIELIKDTFDLTADKSGWQVDYEISALVTPVITEKMRKELKQQAIASMNSGYRPSSTVSNDTKKKVAGERKSVKQQKRIEAVETRKKQKREIVAREQAVKELEVIKNQATQKAEQEASRQAEEEEKSRKRRVFGAW